MSFNASSLLKIVSNAVLPLKEALNSGEDFELFMLELGWKMPTIPAPISSLLGSFNTVSSIVETLKLDSIDKSTFKQLENAIKQIVDDLNSINTQSSYFTTNYLNHEIENFSNTISKELPDYLICNYLKKNYPLLFQILTALSIIDVDIISEYSIVRVPYTRYRINYNSISQLFTSPNQLFSNKYGWGTNDFESDELLLNLFYILNGLLRGNLNLTRFTNYKDVVDNSHSEIRQNFHVLRYVLWNYFDGTAFAEAALELGPLERDSVNNTLPGLFLTPKLSAGFNSTNSIGDSSWKMSVKSNIDFNDGIMVQVRPVVGLSIINNLDSIGTQINGFFTISLSKEPEPDQAHWTIIGEENGTSLKTASVGLLVGFRKEGDNTDLFAQLDLKNCKLIIEKPDGDGFLSKVIPDNGLELDFDFGIGYSMKNGLYFGKNSLGLELALPNIKIGKDTGAFQLKIENLLIALNVNAEKIALQASADIELKMANVITARIEGIGLKSDFEFKRNNGDFGIADVDIDFKFPKGIGLAIKSKLVTGGGFLYLDPAKGKYYGAVELNIKDKFHLTAIAIITTKAPDGSEGFSLLFLINVTFSPSIPLTFGFSLSGIGGMIGVNRSLEPDALRIGVKTGAINHILFPVNVIENITEIIANLESIFPVEQKRYTFGIFFLLNWGVGTPLVRIKFGVILSVPDPVRLAIIGDLNMILPTKESPVLQLNVAFAGIIDFDAKYLTFDATIYNSKLLTFSLYGDMAVRVFWGEHREILMSVGGFHPKYNAPAYLKLPAKMDRLTISLIDKEYDELKLSIKLQTYFAITSNTVQFGARLDLDVRITVIQILGYFGFDVLFQFNPFKFYSNVYAGLAILYKGDPILSISMNFALDGPGPWHAVGDAEFKILGFKKTAHIDKVFGDAPDTTEPTVLIEPKILEALTSNKSISSESPFNKESYIQLYDNSGDDILLDPLGSLVVSQNIAPLGINLEKLGGSKLGDAGKYDIHEVKVNGVIQNLKTNKENFAPAQFRNMNDEDKISSASFEFLKSGVKIESEDQLIDGFVIKPLNYEMIVIDEVKRYTKPVSDNDRHFIKPLVKGGIISENALSKKAGVNGIVPALRVSQEKFKAVSKDSLDDLTTPISKDSLAEAYDTIEYNLQSNYSPYSISPTLTLPTD